MIEKLKGISRFADYKIEFVYEGSIVVITSTIQKDILDIGFEVKPEDFIRQFAEITDLETTTRNRIEVEMFFSSSTSKGKICLLHAHLYGAVCFHGIIAS